MDDVYAVPLQAIQAFESTTGLHVGLYDFSGQLYSYLPPERFVHNNSLCIAVKARHERACVSFETGRMCEGLAEKSGGRVKVCHAGLVEWVVPVIRQGRLDWIVFAGQRTPGKGLREALWDSAAPMKSWPWPRNQKLPPPVDDGEAGTILEMLRQLAARLSQWRDEAGLSDSISQVKQASFGVKTTGVDTRSVLIRRFIQNRHPHPVSLADLAKFLHISESRAGHAVRETCGESFIRLLIEARLKTAGELLRHTNLSVLEVALRSGFGDLSNFHYTFRQRNGLAPHQYRRRFESKARGGKPV